MKNSFFSLCILLLAVILPSALNAQVTCDICAETEVIAPPVRTSAITERSCGDTISICSNTDVPFSTTVVSGASYAWSVIGTGIQIIGPANGATVTVRATVAGYYTICVTKSIPGAAPCCYCKTIYVAPCGGGGEACPPCPLTINMHGEPCYDNTRACIWKRGRFIIECSDGSSLDNWIAANNITGTITWETISGNGGFNGGTCGSYGPMGSGSDGCGYTSVCDPVETHLESGWWCHCTSLPYTPIVRIRATIRFQRGGQTCIKVVEREFFIPECGLARQATGDISWSISPNPNKGSFKATVKTETPAELSFQLISADGAYSKTIATRRIAEGSTEISLRPVGAVPAGSYILVLYANGRQQGQQKLVITQ